MELCGMIDCHVHSANSFDGQLRAKQLLELAHKHGLGGFAVTDHCEINVEGRQRLWSYRSLRRSFREADALRDNPYGIKVICGVELGHPEYHAESAARVLAECEYDFVLASIHFLRDNRDFHDLKYTDGSCDSAAVYDSYLDEVALTAERSDYDSLAHLTYPLRYIVGRDRVELDERMYDDKYDRILRAVAERGKALEINTSGARRENGFMLPDLRLLTRFKELGGRYITIGSDAHKEPHFCAGLLEGAQMAREAGFDSAYYYEQRKPTAYSLL